MYEVVFAISGVAALAVTGIDKHKMLSAVNAETIILLIATSWNIVNIINLYRQ